MNIRQTITTTVVALTMVALVAPAAAGAITAADLQAQINALMAQLGSLQGSSSVPAACVGVTFSRNLTTGSVGSDVKCLQVILNMSASTQVSVSGAGSPGMETTTFGPRTLAAVRIWQASVGITPANQIGPMSRAKLNAWLTMGSSSNNNNNNNPPAPVNNGPVSAMLSPDNPASGNIVGSQALADLLHVKFTGSGTVTSVTLTRTGLSDQNLFTNVYLYDGAMRLTDGYSFNNSGILTMNGLSLSVQGMRTISVRGDVMASASATQGNVVVSVTSFTANGNAAASSIMGNVMYVVSASLATVNFGTGANTAVSGPSGTASINAGTMGYAFWTQSTQVNTRTVWLKGANFKMTGSAPFDALSNVRLYIDGVDTGKVGMINMVNGSTYATFDFMAAPLTLSTGSHTLELRADVQRGINRTMQVSIDQASDLMVFDQQVGVNIAVGTTGSGALPSKGGTVTIATGSPTVNNEPVFNAMTNITGGGSNAVLGKFVVHAYGDDLKITSLKIAPVVTSATASSSSTDSSGVCTGTCGLSNVALYFNGSQVGSSTNISGATAFDGSTTTQVYTLGSQMIAPAGMDSILEVRGDLQTTGSVTYTAGTVGVNIIAVANYATSMGSQDTLTFPTASVTGHTLTVQTGTLSAAADTNYSSQTLPPNASGLKLASFVLQNTSTSESVRVTNYAIKLTYGAGAGSTNFAALKTDEMSGSGATPIQPTSTAASGNGTDNFSVNFMIAPGATKTVSAWINSGATSGSTVTVRADLNTSYTGVSSNVSTTTGFKTGPTITIGTGTIATPTLVTSSTTTAQFIAAGNGGAVDGSKATFSLISAGGNATVNELKFTISGNTTSVTSVRVGTVSAPVISGVAWLTGLNIAVPNAGSGVNIDAYPTYTTVGNGGIVSSQTSITSLTYVKYTSGGTSATLSPSVAAPTMTLVGSKPTVAVNTASVNGLNLGAENKIGEITVTADAKGNIKINDLQFAVSNSSWATAPTFTAARIADGTTTITGSSCGQGTAAAVSQTIFCEFANAGTTITTTATTDTETNTDFDGYTITAGTSKTFSLFATVNGTANATTGAGSIATSLVAAGLNWDDTASAIFVANGSAASPNQGTALTGSSIYNFPTGSYSIRLTQ